MIGRPKRRMRCVRNRKDLVSTKAREGGPTKIGLPILQEGAS